MENRPDEFSLIKRLPPYVFSIVNDLKIKARARGEDIIDLGMGNPDQPPPKHIIDKLVEASCNPRNHRYSSSQGIPKLRRAVCDWYKRNYDVELDPDSETIVTIGSKEGISHLMISILSPGEVVIVPSPTYPIHSYSTIIARADVQSVPLTNAGDTIEAIENAVKEIWPKPKAVIVSFPHNPTTAVVDLDFFQRLYDLAKENGLIVIHDFAYAELCYDGYKAPSFLQIPGAKEVGVESYSLSKSYNMPGWRVAFMVGSPRIIAALKRIKSYLDYGIFQPIQIAAIAALNGPQDCVGEICNRYMTRRDKLVEGLARAGWEIPKPLATMFVWAEIPDEFKKIGSLEFSKLLLEKANVAVSPGIGFGNRGEGYVRFALVENTKRITQAVRGIRRFLNGTSV